MKAFLSPYWLHRQLYVESVGYAESVGYVESVGYESLVVKTQSLVQV